VTCSALRGKAAPTAISEAATTEAATTEAATTEAATTEASGTVVAAMKEMLMLLMEVMLGEKAALRRVV
jgi:hypothetical protein